MANKIPKKVKERLVTNLKRFQPILKAAYTRDINESDTVTVVTDLLSDLFGYDKYTEITSEFCIKGTFCDLALKVGEATLLLVEVKAIGLKLTDSHIRQAVNYAANKEGTEWVALTNGITWEIFRVTLGKTINKELVLEFNICNLNHRSNDDIESLYILSKEGRSKSALKEYHTQRKAMDRHFVGAIILSDPVLSVIRKELRKLSPGVNVHLPEIKSVVESEVLKREVTTGDEADNARKKVERAAKRQSKQKKKKASVIAEPLETTSPSAKAQAPTVELPPNTKT